MRLKQIRLAGFKSFVDATSVPFPQQMTAVVGPNGCGKSNVIDAVRWVLGESSAKNLRGDAMTDVIFNGSTQRKPVSQASVELVFENTAGRLQGSMADRSEIAIKRLVTRDAQSTYFLNGSKCRRRDITDIFLGTGLGPRSYAIIEQGMISRLIESKPQELRVFIEEAAGISKYKERRRETENRIRHTRENLERLADVREELAKNLDKLKRQASTAERYKTLKARERTLKSEVTALRWLTFHQLQTKLEQQLSAAETELEKYQAAHLGDQRVLIELKEQQQDHRQQQAAEQETFYRLGAEISHIEQRLLHQRQQRQQRHEQVQLVQQQLADANAHLTAEQQQLAEQQELIEVTAPEQELLQQQVEELQHQADALEQQSENKTQQWQQWQQHNFQLQQQQQQQQMQLQHAQQRFSQHQQTIQQLKQELSELQSIDPAAVNAAEQEYQRSTELTAERKSQTEVIAQQLQHSNDRLQQQQRQLDRLQLEQQQLQNVQQKLEQAQRQAGQQPLVAQMDVKPGWAQAVTMALGGLQHARLQANWPEELEHSVLLPSGDSTGSGRNGSAESLAHKVQSGEVPDFFHCILTAEQPEQARQMLPGLTAGYSVITANGLWFGSNWCMLPQPELQNSYLARAERLQQLTDELSMAEQQLSISQNELDALQNEVDHLQQQQRNAHQLWQQAQQQEQELRTNRLLLQQQHQQQQQQQQRIEQELERLQTQQQETELQQESLSEQLLLHEEALQQHQAAQHSLQDDKAQLQQQQAELKARLLQKQQQWQQLTLQLTSSQRQQQILAQNVVRSRQHLQQLQERQQQLQHLDDEGRSDEALQEQLQETLVKREAAEQALQRVHNALAECEQKIRQLEQGQQSIMQVVDQKRQQLESLRLDAEGHRVRANSMLELLQEQQVNLKAVLETLASDADEQQLQNELDKTSDAISRLGAINLAAIDEYQQQAERKSYLDAQHQDLTLALETLETAIRKIDKETRQRFKVTYEQVDQGLRSLFPKVFGGGSAYLQLTDDDLLETGVSIMARPPGKKNSTIHLLSGGEKALTALSLVFSIFQLNPAPFCMLDEVDAPLDDANVGRFCNLVREMSETVQFIYISHNKIAMEMATQLMGVTMQEPGVSRVVAVDVDDAVKMAEAS
ncbi:chromosome segregation protein SMC [Alkalimonas collagenimarina]|uniref:Chromosome partition protein Smc n=1 Tax=Alkalimonas collagenimarina TaxID=400390 RepID=A0ABT9GUE7_9GAMM|nr:chromosome segregation protein SMC [Alkalimonas collagenimarina]MDP4534677.1 chromosome segregation protein SMC [Alkalimonas collagenimarina]